MDNGGISISKKRNKKRMCVEISTSLPPENMKSIPPGRTKVRKQEESNEEQMKHSMVIEGIFACYTVRWEVTVLICLLIIVYICMQQGWLAGYVYTKDLQREQRLELWMSDPQKKMEPKLGKREIKKK